MEHRMQSFMPVFSSDISSIISSSPAKHCELDPLPMTMLKENLVAFSGIIANIVNTSLQQGVVSGNLKEALLKPLIKLMSLEVIFKSFHLISNLSFPSKMIERVVCGQLSNYMNRTGKLEDLQSPYRSNHLTETALLKVKTDILNAMQNKQVTCLILLDLSAAFDTISHYKIINRLKFRFGLDDVGLDWITDYLANCTQRVMIKQDKFLDSATSSPVTLAQGIPQGLVIGLNLFSWFIFPLSDLYRKYEIDCHRYADHRQLYLSFKPVVPMDQVTCIRRLELCIAEIRCWIRTNFLKLNDSQDRIHPTRNTISVAIIQPTDCVRNLGYMYDAELKKISHINKLVSTCYVTLRRISGIRDLLDYDTCKILVQALVLAKVDYCNSLLLGSSQYVLDKLQKIQNMAA